MIKTLLTICNHGTALEMINQNIAEKYIFICSKKINQSQLPKNYIIGKNVISYSHRAMKKFRYFKKTKWNSLYPLDADLVEALYDCESITMKMLDRIPAIRSTYESRRKYYYDNLQYWYHIIKTNNVEAFYRCAPPHEGYDMPISGICEYLKIKTLYFNPFHPGLCYLGKTVKKQFPDFKDKLIYNCFNLEIDKINLKPEIEKLFQEHLNKKIPSQLPVIIPRRKKRTQKTLLTRYKNLNKFYDTKAIIPDLKSLKGNYIYFPLHFQWEATTCPMGGMFVDQYRAIEILSKLDIPILVKEHKRMSKNRNMDFYIRIIKMKNVKLIKKTINNYDLIDNCLSVASITGTAGIEGLMRLKPCLVFGNIYYEDCQHAYKIRTVKNAIEAIRTIKGIGPIIPLDIKIFLYTLQEYLLKHDTKSIVTAIKKELEKE